MHQLLKIGIVKSLIPSFIIYQYIMMNEVNLPFYHSLLWGFVYLLTRCLQAVVPKANLWLVGIILLSGTVQAVVSMLQYIGYGHPTIPCMPPPEHLTTPGHWADIWQSVWLSPCHCGASAINPSSSECFLPLRC